MQNKPACCRVEDFDGLMDDLRTDPVPGEKRDPGLTGHGYRMSPECARLPNRCPEHLAPRGRRVPRAGAALRVSPPAPSTRIPDARDLRTPSPSTPLPATAVPPVRRAHIRQSHRPPAIAA